jgi:hypothetical protein
MGMPCVLVQLRSPCQDAAKNAYFYCHDIFKFFSLIAVKKSALI